MRSNTGQLLREVVESPSTKIFKIQPAVVDPPLNKAREPFPPQLFCVNNLFSAQKYIIVPCVSVHGEYVIQVHYTAFRSGIYLSKIPVTTVRSSAGIFQLLMNSQCHSAAGQYLLSHNLQLLQSHSLTEDFSNSENKHTDI